MPVLATLNSACWPILGLFLSKVQFTIIELSYLKNDETRHERNAWFLAFLLCCFVIGSIVGSEKLIFGFSGENLTANVRKLLFRGILFKQVSWFDDEQKAPGVLTTMLSEEVSTLNGMTTETLSTVMEAILGLIIGVLLACYFSWPIALMTLASFPIMIIGVIGMSKL